MATHKSAAKRARQTVKRNALNRSRRAKLHTTTKAVEQAVAKKDASLAKKSMTKAESTLARAARKGMIHWKTAARKTSRLAKRVKTMSAKNKA